MVRELESGRGVDASQKLTLFDLRMNPHGFLGFYSFDWQPIHSRNVKPLIRLRTPIEQVPLTVMKQSVLKRVNTSTVLTDVSC